MKKKTLGIREFQCLGKSAMIDKKEAKHIVWSTYNSRAIILITQ